MENLRAAVDVGDEIVGRDRAFHQTLISACGSRVLMQTHAEVFDKYLRYQMIALAFRPSASRPEHRALKDAALGRDVDGAIAILRHHINAGVQHALSSNAPYKFV